MLILIHNSLGDSHCNGTQLFQYRQIVALKFISLFTHLTWLLTCTIFIEPPRRSESSIVHPGPTNFSTTAASGNTPYFQRHSRSPFIPAASPVLTGTVKIEFAEILLHCQRRKLISRNLHGISSSRSSSSSAISSQRWSSSPSRIASSQSVCRCGLPVNHLKGRN